MIANKLSPSGKRFLESTTAAPDYSINQCDGVPDMYAGKSVMKQFVMQQSVDTTAGKDNYFVFLPTPGVAVWTSSADFGVMPTAFTGVAFADAVQVFDTFDTVEPAASGFPQSSSQLVDRFRFTGLSAELECVMNDLTWAGDITVAKSPIRLVEASTAQTHEAVKVLTGLEAINFVRAGNGQVYRGPVNKGCYSVASNTDATFVWSDVLPGAYSNSAVTGQIENSPLLGGSTIVCGQDPIVIGPSRGPGPIGTPANIVFTGPMVGIDAFDAIVFKVSVPTGAANQSFVLKVWQNIEFAPIAMSLFSEMAMRAPPHDQLALDAYKYIVQGLPVAVEQSQNPDFWKHVIKILGTAKRIGTTVSGLITHAPGEAGVIAKGINALLKSF